MVTEDRFGLRPIWDASLVIYKEIAKICDRHRLRYYATDGTALGAIRHKGYIPWDDDFDISMPRPDYEKFIRFAESELPAHLKFVSWRNTPEYHLLFGKVQNVNRECVEGIEREVGHVLSNGIFVDVFPIEGYPSSILSRIKIRGLDYIYSKIVWARFPRAKKGADDGQLLETLKTLVRAFWCFVSRICFSRLKNWQDILGAYERLCEKYTFDDCEFTGRTCSANIVLRRAPLKKSAWGNAVNVEFHDTIIKVPEDWDAHLRNEYFKWDYMQLPPEDQRHPTHEYSYRCPWWLGPTTNAKAY